MCRLTQDLSRWPRHFADYLARPIIGIGLGTEADGRLVHLGFTDDIGQQARAGSHGHDKQAGRERIECPRMPHAASSGRATHQSDHIMGGAAGRLVDVQQTRQHRSADHPARSALHSHRSVDGTGRLNRAVALFPLIADLREELFDA